MSSLSWPIASTHDLRTGGGTPTEEASHRSPSQSPPHSLLLPLGGREAPRPDTDRPARSKGGDNTPTVAGHGAGMHAARPCLGGENGKPMASQETEQEGLDRLRPDGLVSFRPEEENHGVCSPISLLGNLWSAAAANDVGNGGTSTQLPRGELLKPITHAVGDSSREHTALEGPGEGKEGPATH